MKTMLFFDKKFFKFILVGIINTIVGSSIMFSLYNIAHLSYWLSSACNYFFASILSFFLNKYFTFNVKQWSVFMIFAFVVNIAICYGIAYGIAKPAMNFLLRNSPLKIRENAALFTGMCLFTGVNYLGQRLIVFRYKGNEEREKKNDG
jgi:putative flippase GtrA